MTGAASSCGARGSIQTGLARKAIDDRQFSLGNNPQIRAISSDDSASSESHTVSWNAAGTASGEAASIARTASASRPRPAAPGGRAGADGQQEMQLERDRGFEQPRRIVEAGPRADALGVAQLRGGRDEVQEEHQIGIGRAFIGRSEADDIGVGRHAFLIAERRLEHFD
ncbi:MAG: hypothetical protein WDN24_20155 [Sphingomonas sp.]